MAEGRDLTDVLARVARVWRDPEHPARAEAVARTLEAPNRFTEEAVAFAVNHWMHTLAREAPAWTVGRPTKPRTVEVWHAGRVPLDGLEDLLAVLRAGHRYRGVLAAASPYLLPAFVAALAADLPGLPVTFIAEGDHAGEPDALIAADAEDVRARAEERWACLGLRPERCLLRPVRFAVAVIDGRETADEREGLAVDALLYEGRSPRNTVLIFAPEGLAPDPYLEAFATFRGVFPAHPDTPGALQMQKALLEAYGQPHAYGEGPSFLISKGPADVQSPGHLRWVEYAVPDEVQAFLAANRERLTCVVARPAVARRMRLRGPVVAPGMAHRFSPEDAMAEALGFLARI
ncbi:MAG: hypothetical protein D6746_09400 [Bacteroidetes bacterium]|nr:MAG: hypothetical protein D6746_09400 [Bacteroidota bacterium]